MIIDDEYLISCFHLTSGRTLRNDLFVHKPDTRVPEDPEDGDFNFYQVDDNKQMKLFNRTKGKGKGKDCIVEVMVGIISPDRIEYIEVMQIEKVPEHFLDILDIDISTKDID